MSPLLMSMAESLLTILVKQIDNGSKQLIVMMGHNSMNQHRKVGKKN